MIEFQNVERSYGRKVAVAALDLTVRSGELFAFLGPNGAGKTTTIKMLVGLLRPSAGKIRICGHDTVGEHREAQRLIGYVPDEPYLYDKLSGREFLRFIAGMYGISPAEAEARIEREADHFELHGFMDDLTESYSHGMKQRIVFAAALLHEPQVLVLDEPTVGLDPKNAHTMKELLRKAVSRGATVFMSTHTLAMAEEIADRIGIVNHGKLLFVGTVSELREQVARHDRSLEQLFLDMTSGNGEAPKETLA